MYSAFPCKIHAHNPSETFITAIFGCLYIYCLSSSTLEHTVTTAAYNIHSGYYEPQYKLNCCHVSNHILGEEKHVTIHHKSESTANCQHFANSRTRTHNLRNTILVPKLSKPLCHIIICIFRLQCSTFYNLIYVRNAKGKIIKLKYSLDKFPIVW